MFYDMSNYEAIIWIILAVVAVVYLVKRNQKLISITDEIIKLNKKNESEINELLDKLTKASTKSEKQKLLDEMLKIERNYKEIVSDRKKWPQQGPRIKRHIVKIHSLIANALEQIQGYEIE